jgi:abortive infection bacteriophage resistance protein
MRYTKPYKTVSQQIEILTSRGLIVSDEAKAKAYLERIGYYRLSGYAYPFRVAVTMTDANGKRVVSVGDDFKSGVEFRHIVDLYVFDKKLRLAMLDGIERVEIGLRTSIALLMGQRGPWSHRDASQLDGTFSKRVDRRTGRVPHQEWRDKLDETFSRSNEEFAKHFKQRYPHDPLPIWIATELWDFGMLSRFYEGMLFNDRQAIARQYGINDPDVLQAWLKSINYVRNLCAHHSRLWNRPLVRQGMFPAGNGLTLLDHLAAAPTQQTRLYGTAAAIRFLLLTINPATSWPARIKAILDTFPDAPSISLRNTGFPEGWESLPLWTIPSNGGI